MVMEYDALVAALEATAYQTREVVDAMKLDSGVQRFAAKGGYTGPSDGVMGTNSWKGVQTVLQGFGYTGPIDGVMGTNSYAALQRVARRGTSGGHERGSGGHEVGQLRPQFLPLPHAGGRQEVVPAPAAGLRSRSLGPHALPGAPEVEQRQEVVLQLLGLAEGVIAGLRIGCGARGRCGGHAHFRGNRRRLFAAAAAGRFRRVARALPRVRGES